MSALRLGDVGREPRRADAKGGAQAFAKQTLPQEQSNCSEDDKFGVPGRPAAPSGAHIATNGHKYLELADIS